MTLQELTESFAIPGVLSFAQTDTGLTRAVITLPSCTAELYLQGAHLTAWQPTGQQPVIFLSERSPFEPAKPIRGGIPVIFPWFGPRSPAVTGSRTDGPSHGFARTSLWTLAAAAVLAEDLTLTLTLGPSEESRSLGFDHFLLVLEVNFGRELRLRLSVANHGPAPLHVEQALHTYFTVSDAASVALTGLQNTQFIDKTDGFKLKTQSESELHLTAVTDRLYLDTPAAVTLRDPGLQRTILVAKSGSNSTVVWNPWSELSARMADMTPTNWQHMVCVETANAARNLITLPPSSTHTLEARISLQELPTP